MTRAAILSTDRLPKFLGENHPTEDGLFAEDDILITALAECGIEGERVPWRRPDIDWADFDIAVLRSTWDYLEDLTHFLEVLELAAKSCQLINPLGTVRWNYDKRYLEILKKAGAPIVPSLFITRHELADGVLGSLPAGFGPDGLIVKPTVGVGAFETFRVDRTESLIGSFTAQLSSDSYMIQPFLPSIRAEGEWSFIFFGGALAYTARKVPANGDWRVQVMYGATTLCDHPSPGDRAAAEHVMRLLPVSTVYARIDMARLADGSLALMEAELIEPQLFFADVPAAAPAFARAIADNLEAAPQ